MGEAGRVARAVDGALDRSVVLGYTRIGSAVRSRWWPADPPPMALAGKRVLVTGATSGLGAAAVHGMLDLGAQVFLLGRDPVKVDRAVGEAIAASPGAKVVGEICDVGDLDDVRRWAADFAGRVPALHGLLHNAGTMTGDERTTTAQGHELTLAVHVLGPHLITGLLLDQLRAAGREEGASVVWMSSGGMYSARLHADDADDIEYRNGSYDGVQAYARTKRMQVVIAQEWASALTQDGIRVESMHPGWAGTPGVRQNLPKFERLTRPLLRSAEDGADTAVWLIATRPESGPGHFWHDRALRPVTWSGRGGPEAQAVERFLDYVVTATGMPLPS
ncbi:SDR family NAD(P)-dependent oxidoreductase [Nocardioides sp. BGMRC 2183]|nr:SDR family NAD(P)-dependent oxidoreductase [Nocardioides sp. BGMRC 2183]